MGRKWRRRLGKTAKVLGFLVLAGLVGGYVYIRQDFVARADRLEEEMAIAKGYGIPLDPESMDRYSKVPIERNAAPKYAAAFERMNQIKGRPGFLEPEAMLLFADKECREIYRPSIGTMREINAEIRAATALPDFALKKDWSAGWKLAFPEYADSKRAADWLSDEAILAGFDGDWDLANSNLAAIGKLGWHFGRERVLIGGLVQVAISAIGNRTAAKLAEIAQRDSAQLEQIRATAAAMPGTPDFAPYLESEAYMGF